MQRRPGAADRHAARSCTRAPPTPTWPSSWATATCSRSTRADHRRRHRRGGGRRAAARHADGAGAAPERGRRDTARRSAAARRRPGPGDGELAEYHGRDFYALGPMARTARSCISAPRCACAAGRDGAARAPRASGCWCTPHEWRAALPLRLRLRERGLDGVTLLVLPGVLFVLRCSSTRSCTGWCCRSRRRRGGWLANYARSSPIRSSTTRSGTTLLIAVPGDAAEHPAVGPGGAARAADARAEAADHDPGHPDHPRHGAGGRRAAELSRPARLAEPRAAGVRHRRQPGAAGPQLLGRDAVAGDHRLSVHLPADAVLRHRHRSGARAGRRDAGRAGTRTRSAASCCRCWRRAWRSRSAWPSCRPSPCSPPPCCWERRRGRRG